MKIVVCEDLKTEMLSFCSLVETYLKEINCPAEIIKYDNGEAFIDDFVSQKITDVQIAFLDIYMPGKNGIDVAEKIRETDKDMIIIFTTTSLDHGIEGFAVKAFRYLVKPIEYPHIKDTLDDCMEIFAESMRFIEVISNKVAIRIPLKNIVYVEVIAHDCMIYTMTGTVKCRFSLDEMEKQLEGSTFLRTHRSFIVNMRYIKSIKENNFLLTTGALIPIRKNGNLQVKQVYMDYMFTQVRKVR